MRNFKKIIIMVLPAILLAGCMYQRCVNGQEKLIKEYGFPMFYKWNNPNIIEIGLTPQQVDEIWKFYKEPDENKDYFYIGSKDKKFYYIGLYGNEWMGSIGASVNKIYLKNGKWKYFKTKNRITINCELDPNTNWGNLCVMMEWIPSCG